MKLIFIIEKLIKKYFFIIYILIKKYFFFIMFLLSYYLYFLSLGKCFDGVDECCVKFKWIKKKIIEEILSCLIASLLVELIFYNIVSKYHLFHFLIIFLLFYKYSHGMDFHDHGYFNLLFFIIIFFGILVALSPFNAFIYFTKYKNKKYKIICLFFLINIIYLFYFINKIYY